MIGSPSLDRLITACPVFTEPRNLVFRALPATDRPSSTVFFLINATCNDLVVNFDQISSDTIWFTLTTGPLEEQKLYGFDIFYEWGCLTSLVVKANSRTPLSCVIVPVTESTGRSVSIPYYEVGKTEVKYIQLAISYEAVEIAFRVLPEILFLNDCSKGEEVKKHFRIANECSLRLPIMIYSRDDTKVVTQDGDDMLWLEPNQVALLEVRHTPQNVGQFVHLILFSCLMSTEGEVQTMKLVTSVSPTDVPPDFPVLSVENNEMDFGEVHAGSSIESHFTITNPGDDAYRLTVIGVADLLTISSIDPKEIVLLPDCTSKGSQISLRMASSDKVGSEMKNVTLNSYSSVTIWVTYTPTFNSSMDPSDFDHRLFMIGLTFFHVNSRTTHYRRIKCRAAVCHSLITVSPERIDFGDTTIDRSYESPLVTIHNKSPLRTTVTARSTSRSLVVVPTPIEIEGHGIYQFSFTFHPRKLKSEFNGSIIFSNTRNKSNKFGLSVYAIVVGTPSDAVHAESYGLVSEGYHVSSFDFQKSPIGYPRIKSFTIKNRKSVPLKISFLPSSSEIAIYREQKQFRPSRQISEGGSLPSIAMDVKPELPLLKSMGQITTFNDLEQYEVTNTALYSNFFSLMERFREPDIVRHFEIWLSSFNSKIGELETAKNVDIEIRENSRETFYLVLKPNTSRGRPVIWQQRNERLKITLPDIDVEPLLMPVTFEAAISTMFSLSRHLSFGNVQAGKPCKYKIHLWNASQLPLLYTLESNAVTFDNNKCGIIWPFGWDSLPFTLSTDFLGALKEQISVHNALNPKETITINLKGNAEAKSNLFISDKEVIFQNISTGSSDTQQIFITNLLDSDNEITLSHVKGDVGPVVPLMRYQLKELNQSDVSEGVKMQVEKLERKVRCLERKGKNEYAAKVKKRIEAKLGNARAVQTSSQTRQMAAKYLDTMKVLLGPSQFVCIELRLILYFPAPITKDIKFDGTIIVGESATDNNHYIRYKAKVEPDRSPISITQNSLTVEPNSITIDHVPVHECVTAILKIKNVSTIEQHYWFSTGQSNRFIVSPSHDQSEGKLGIGEEVEIPIDIFAFEEGLIKGDVSIVTNTGTVRVPLQISAEYQKLLEFPDLPNDHVLSFGGIPLTFLSAIEERGAFTIVNSSDRDLFVSFTNDSPRDVLIYEQDPQLPQFRPLKLLCGSSVRMNVILQPVIDPQDYQKYKRIDICTNLTIQAFETLREAEQAQGRSCLFASQITVTAVISRIGLSCTDNVVDFGSVPYGVHATQISVQNRSEGLSVEANCTPGQGLRIDPPHFRLEPKESKPITITYTPSTDGINETEFHIAVQTHQNLYQKAISVRAFVDSGYIQTNLPRNSRNIDCLDLGPLYVDSGKPEETYCVIPLKNASAFSLEFEIEGTRYRLGSGKQFSFARRFPFSEDFYEREKRKSEFSYRLKVVSCRTGSVLKVVEIVGKFVISKASLEEESVSLGRFGRINNWAYTPAAITIKNEAIIPLELEAFCDTSLIEIPVIADPVPSLSSLVLPIRPCLKKCTEEGRKTAVIKFRNRHNRENKFSCRVTFELRHSFLLLEGASVVNDHYEMMMGKLNQFIDQSDSENKCTANSWFKLTNRLDREITVDIEIQEQENTNVRLFMKKTETQIDSIDLQPEETVDIRVKAIVSHAENLAHKQQSDSLWLAIVRFKSEGLEVISLHVCCAIPSGQL